jgi:hypothetical protein
MKKKRKKNVTPIQNDNIPIPDPDVKFQGIPVSLFPNYGESAWAKWLTPVELLELELVRDNDDEFTAYLRLRRTALNRRNAARANYDPTILERVAIEYNEQESA